MTSEFHLFFNRRELQLIVKSNQLHLVKSFIHSLLFNDGIVSITYSNKYSTGSIEVVNPTLKQWQKKNLIE